MLRRWAPDDGRSAWLRRSTAYLVTDWRGHATTLPVPCSSCRPCPGSYEYEYSWAALTSTPFRTTPTTLAPTCRIELMLEQITAWRVDPARTTRRALPTRPDNTNASVSVPMAGVSKITRSARSSRSRSTAVILSDANSSAGLGGWGPLARIRRFGTMVRRRSPTSSARRCATRSRWSRAVLKPVAVKRVDEFKWKRVLKVGWRRLASTRLTCLPAWATAMARLAAIVLLPSPATELVTTRLLRGSFGLPNSRFVRKARNASLVDAFG